MAFELWARATAKWRGILIYTIIQVVARCVSQYIQFNTESPSLLLYGSLSGVATNLYSLVQIWRLLTSDREGDEAWPAFWG